LRGKSYQFSVGIEPGLLSGTIACPPKAEMHRHFSNVNFCALIVVLHRNASSTVGRGKKWCRIELKFGY
jgi:hypothetical protein